MNANERLVTDFCAAWSRLDVEELLGYLTEDCRYHNIPMKPCVGHDRIRRFLAAFLEDATSARFEILHTTSAGNVVMNERVDRIELGSRSIALPVAGVFEIRDGRIAAWRDYFDLATFDEQMRAGSAA